MAAELPFQGDMPPHVLAILKEAMLAQSKPALARRERAGLPKPSAAEVEYLSNVITAAAVTTLVAALMRFPEWSEEQVEEAYVWMRKEYDRCKAFGKS